MPITRDTYDEASRYMAQLANHAMKRKAAGEFDFDDASSGRTYKRTRSGCFTCRLRRKKCDEGRPSCGACVGLNVKCEYQQPNWWSSSELRHLQKGKVKDDIKANKVTMKNHHAYVGRHANSTSPMTPGFTFNPSYQPAENYSYSPDFQSASYGQQQQLQQLPPVFQSASYEEHQQIQPQPPVFQSAFYEQHQQIQQQPPVFQSAFYEQHPQLQQPLAQMQLQQQLPELDPQLQLQLPQLELPLPMPQIQLEQLPEFDPQLQLQPPPVFQSAFYEQYPQLQPPLAPMQLPQLSELDLQPQLDPQLDPQLQLQLQREQQEQQEQEQKRQEQERQMQKQQELEKAHQKQQEQERQKRKQQEQEKAKQKQREQERQKQKQQEQEKQKKKQQEQEKQKQKQQEQEKQKQRQRQQEQEKQKQKQQKQQEQQEQQKQKQSQEKQQEQEKQKQKQQEQQKQKGQQEQQKQKQKQPQQQPLYQVDVTTERQVFVNDVETQKETSVSSFKTSMPPPPLPDTRNPARFATDPMPGYPGPGPDPGPHSGPEPFPSRPRRNPEDVSIIIANDGPLLSHFIDNVLRFFFPISEARQGPEDHQRIKAILDSLEHNQSYFHCCLGVAAIHLKGTVGHKGKDFDSDILRHRFEAVSALSEALGKNEDYHRVLDSSLAMIIFHCAVASPVEDNLPDIAWYHHFEAAVSLLSRLGFLDPAATIHHINPPFSASLATWIDILGATMLGRPPRFAETYRVKNAEDTPSGLYQLMGCEDRVMYIISEIACLDALKLQGNANHIAVCAQIASLGRQLENSEPRDPKLEHPFVPATGELRADKLMKTITAIFRIAARVYLCSLVPGFDRHQESNLNLIEAGTRALDYLPDGPNGYDRCIVWPLLIIGTYSVPTSTIRLVLHRRMIEMGDDNNFGNWSRLYRVLVEIWRRSDGQLRNVPGRSHTTPEGAQIMRQTRPQAVHWRGVLIEKRWDYLLL